MLLDHLADFITRHRPCGQLIGDDTEPAPEGYMLSIVCSCGVVFMRWVTPEKGGARVSDVRLGDLDELEIGEVPGA